MPDRQQDQQEDGRPIVRALGLRPGVDLDPAVRAFRTVLVLAQELRTRMDERLRADGLTTMQAAALTAVVHLDDPTASQVAAALGSTRQNVAQLVTALQRKGFVEVRGDAGDRRRTLVVTERARRYWAGRDDGDVAAVRGWFAALDGPELATLTDLATKVLAHAASQRPPHPPSRRPPHRPSVPDTPDGGAGT